MNEYTRSRDTDSQIATDGGEKEKVPFPPKGDLIDPFLGIT